MRENRTYGSEGGEARAFPTPIRGSGDALVVEVLGMARLGEEVPALGERYTMTAIHDYAPALPWYLYLPTQAFAHLRVMRWYQRRLARLAR